MLFNKLKVFKSHGSQYIPDLKAVELPEIFRGRPELSECDAQTAEGYIIFKFSLLGYL